MLEKLSGFIVSRLSNDNVVDVKDLDCYKYGIILLLSKVFITAIIALISLITHTFFESMLFVISFTFLRRYSGGYHCESADSCAAVSVIIYIMFLILYKLNVPVILSVLLIIAAISFQIILFVSPLGSDNKPLTISEKIKYSKSARMIAALFALLTFVFLFSGYSAGLYITGYTLSADGFLLLLGLFKERRKGDA